MRQGDVYWIVAAKDQFETLGLLPVFPSCLRFSFVLYSNESEAHQSEARMIAFHEREREHSIYRSRNQTLHPTVFSFFLTGYAPQPTSEADRFYALVEKEKNLLSEFDLWYSSAKDPAERMYVMVGYYYLNRPQYEEYKNDFNPAELITVMNGCLMWTEPCLNIFAEIEAGEYYFVEKHLHRIWLARQLVNLHERLTPAEKSTMV